MGEDIKFKNVIAELQIINNRYPNLKFGQVLQQAADKYKNKFNANINDIGSKQMLKALQNFHTDLQETRVKKIKKGKSVIHQRKSKEAKNDS